MQQGRGCRIRIDTDCVYAVLDDIAQRFAQPRLRHIMLVLSDANRLGVDFDQLGKRVLQAAGDRNRAAQIGVVLRKFLCGKLARGIH